MIFIYFDTKFHVLLLTEGYIIFAFEIKSFLLKKYIEYKNPFF